MLTSKIRANIRSKISNTDSVCFIGKEGLTDNIIESVLQALLKREGIKITVLQNCDEDIKSMMQDICSKLSAEPIGIVGRKILIYKLNPDNKKHLLD